jgi:hypothetical protein
VVGAVASRARRAFDDPGRTCRRARAGGEVAGVGVEASSSGPVDERFALAGSDVEDGAARTPAWPAPQRATSRRSTCCTPMALSKSASRGRRAGDPTSPSRSWRRASTLGRCRPNGPPRGHSSGHRPRRQPHGRCAPRRRADSTPRCGNWWPVAHLDACPRIGPPSCSARCTATRSPRSNATVSPSNSSPTSAASTVTSPRRECRVTDAVMASGTTLLEVHGVGSIVAGVHPRSRR